MPEKNINTSLIKFEAGAINRITKTLEITKKLLATANKPAIRTYKSVVIGTQEWMVENLNVDHFRNGDVIPEAKTNEEWEEAGNNKEPAWCYYKNNPENGRIYGKLYNWYAVSDPRKISPEGWNVPTDGEWTVLINYLGGENVAGRKLKEAGCEHWNRPNEGSSNSSGFTALPGGYRCIDGTSFNLGYRGWWWSSSKNFTTSAWMRDMDYDVSNVYRSDLDTVYGFSVRCLAETNKPALLTYKSVIIDTQEWMVENLNVDYFRNGDVIPEARTDEEWMEACRNKQPAWCNYENNTENGKIYGKLYNWYAVNDPRNICPEGWWVPNDEIWSFLTYYLGGKGVAACKLKEDGFAHWNRPNEGANNSCGFSALPAGYRNGNGTFLEVGNHACWWSSQELDSDTLYAFCLHIDNNYSKVYDNANYKGDGFSVRCLWEVAY